MRRRRTIHERFWEKVQINGPDECWPWIGGRRHGYGFIKINNIAVVATRFSWSLANGCEVPKGLVVRHTCDNPPCVNPKHLLTGTQRDNTLDAMRRGRHWTGIGESNGNSILERKDVIEIRRLYEEAAWNFCQIARHFDITDVMVRNIVKRRNWKHI